ncbi:RNA polymerase II nuclear import protein Rtp1 [Schizosaccharomyces osmophilus]|uniref:RNA polymerase II nuclear import protein Rtp1 n=1 Tax=Schizosaccharomyces osmophilus TaxID=2545709 RepID=A0AAF0AUR5_9SCHI|nr:RNA polymerase II nuclear import protein Rtp1 [Schizosaccharomyces osmophilus]WBW71882.1 RNA polymerase II nuclear import protein Rtp1 [Schizosaccharomyces osmophilus]
MSIETIQEKNAIDRIVDLTRSLNNNNDSSALLTKLQNAVGNQDVLETLLSQLAEIVSYDPDMPVSITSIRCLQLSVHLVFLLGIYTQVPKELLAPAKIKAVPPFSPKTSILSIFKFLVPALLKPNLLQGPVSLHYADLLMVYLYLQNTYEPNLLNEDFGVTKESLIRVMSPEFVDPAKMISACLQLLQPKVPPWMRTQLNHYLTTSLCKRNGVEGFLKVFMQINPNSIERAQQAARLISSVPKNMNEQTYLSLILPQIWNLFFNLPRLACQITIALLATHRHLTWDFLNKQLSPLMSPTIIDLTPVENCLKVLDAFASIGNEDMIKIAEGFVPSLLQLQPNSTLGKQVQESLLTIISKTGTRPLLQSLESIHHLSSFCHLLSNSQLAQFLPQLLELWVMQPAEHRLELLEVVQYALTRVDTDEIPSELMVSVCSNLIGEVTENLNNSESVLDISSRRDVVEENEEILLILLHLLSSVIGRNRELGHKNSIPSLLSPLKQLADYPNQVISALANDVYKTLIKENDDYSSALSYIHNDQVPVRGQGIYMLRKLIEAKDKRVNPLRILHTLLGLLTDEDSYVHLNVIAALVSLCDKYGDMMIQLLSEYSKVQKYSTDETLLIGQAIYQSMERLGELTSKYYGQIEQTCLILLNDEVIDVKISALNVAELLCRYSSSNAFVESAAAILNLEKTEDKKFLRRVALQVLNSSSHLPSSVITILEYLSTHDEDGFIREQCSRLVINKTEENRFFLG